MSASCPDQHKKDTKASTPTTQTTQTATKTLVKPSAKEPKLIRPVDTDRLRFSPYAFAKFKWLRDRGREEIGAFGISSIADPTYVYDIRLPKQEVGLASVEFDEDDLPNYMDDMIDEGFQPVECFRIWLHTHPGMSATPSGTDEKTFDEAFGNPDWAIMCILGTSGEITARLRVNASGGIFSMYRELKTVIDVTGEFPAVTEEDVKKWEEEYLAKVQTRCYSYTYSTKASSAQGAAKYNNDAAHAYGYGGACGDDNGYDEWYEQAWRQHERKEQAEDDEWFNTQMEEHVAFTAEHPVALAPEEDEYLDFESVDILFNGDYITDVYGVEEMTFVCFEDYFVAYVGEPKDMISTSMPVNSVADISRSKPIAWGELEYFHTMSTDQPLVGSITTMYGEAMSYSDDAVLIATARDIIYDLLMLSPVEEDEEVEEQAPVDGPSPEATCMLCGWKGTIETMAVENGYRSCPNCHGDGDGRSNVVDATETQQLAVADIVKALTEDEREEEAIVAYLNGEDQQPNTGDQN